MKKLARALGLCCLILATTAMSPTNKYLRIKEDSKDGLVVLSVIPSFGPPRWRGRACSADRAERARDHVSSTAADVTERDSARAGFR